MNEQSQEKGFFEGLEYFLVACNELATGHFREAFCALRDGVNGDIEAKRDIDGSQLLACLQAVIAAAQVNLEAERVPGWEGLGDDLEAE